MEAAVICERCGLRPAVAEVRRTRPGVGTQTQRLCQVCLAEVRGESGSYGGRGSSTTSSRTSSIEARAEGSTAREGWASASGRIAARRSGVEQVDITEYFSDATRELLQRAAQGALEWGDLDLNSEHLLWAALQDDLVAHVLDQIDVDAQAVAAEVEQEASKQERTDVAPSLSPRRRGPSWALTRSLGSSALHTSGPSTCYWPSLQTRSPRQGRRFADSVRRTRSCAARSSAASRKARGRDGRRARPRASMSTAVT